MKLHLPKKFQTALMAAFATLSFSTVSTASLGAAVFAFAGYQAAAEEATNTEQSEADKEGQEEIRDNIRFLQEKQDEENERETTVDPVDWDVMERRAKNLEREGDAAASGLAKEAYEQMEAEIFNPAATSAAPEQQHASAGSGELPSDDLGFTTNPYATSTGNSGPVFEVTPAAPAADFLQETSTEQESTSPSSSGSSSPAPASSSGFGGSADSGYVPFGHVSSNRIPLGVSSIPAAANGTPQLAPLGAAEANGKNLVWKGTEYGKSVWQNGGTVTDSPWQTYVQGGGGEQTSFTNGDTALFEYSAVVTVSGDVRTDSLQLNKGTADNMLEVTINTGEGAKLTANHVVTTDVFEQQSFYNKIVKKGAGEIDFTIDDPSFGTILDIQQGTANINFKNGDTFNLYENILGSTSSTVTLNFENSFKAETNVKFSGIDAYNVAAGKTLQIDSTTLGGGGFYLDKKDTTVTLDDGATLNSLYETMVETKHLTIAGKGEAYFNEMQLNHGDEGVAVHDLSDSVYVKITTASLNSQSTVTHVDDEATLVIGTLDTGYSVEQNYYHAFQNGGTETDRQKVTIGNVKTYDGSTIHLGAASTDQGAKNGYQEAGTVNIGKLEVVGYVRDKHYVSATVVLENNVAVSEIDGQCLTEVFRLDTAVGTGSTYFEGTIQLAAKNDGLEDRRKGAIVVFNNMATAYDSTLELDAEAGNTDYAFVMADINGLMCNGIKDVTQVSNGSKAMIYSGHIGDEKNAEIVSDGKFRKLEIYAANDQDYTSSFGISEYINIKLTGNGKQTFTGDFSDFYGDISIGGGSSSGTLSILQQATAVNIEDLTIRQGAVLDVKNQNGQDQLATVKGTLEAMGGPTTAGSGNASVVDGNLRMLEGSTYDVSASYGTGGLDLRGSLTFDQGALLSDKDMAMINGMEIGEMYDLAFDVTALDGHTEAIDWIGDDAIDASTIFGQNQFYQGEFYLCYSGNGQEGGYGNNVGTVYLYRALPEPTTGTLSLLALAALAARRRRK